MPSMHTETDTLIIGAGPIGLELAAALKAAGGGYVHVEAGQIGQTISWYPAQARFFSSPERIAICGVPLVTQDQSKATREEYLAYLRSVVQQHDLEVNTFERVVGIERLEQAGTFNVRTIAGGENRHYLAKRVVLAVGDMHHPNLLHIPGEDLPHVSHYFEEPHRYFRKRLLIVGGRNSMAEAALRCHRAGAYVAVSYRRPWVDERAIKYWLMPELRSLIEAGRIGFHACTRPVQIGPDTVKLAGVKPGLFEPHEAEPPSVPGEPIGPDERREVPADFVLLLTGYHQDPTLFNMAGVELVGENHAPKHDPETMETNVPGVYTAGTAAAGSQQRFRLFIENSHVHVTRIVKAITGREPDPKIVNQVGNQVRLPES